MVSRMAEVFPQWKPPPEPAPDEDRVAAAVAAAVGAAIAELQQPTPPVVHVSPPDLSEVVMAVQALKGPATAEEIAVALRDVLVPQAAPEGVDNATMERIAKALELLDHRMKGVGTQAYGGGAVSLAPGQTLSTTNSSALVSEPYDKVTKTEPTASTQLYTYTSGGATVASVLVTKSAGAFVSAERV